MSALLTQLQTVLASWDASGFSGSDDDGDGDVDVDEQEEDDYHEEQQRNDAATKLAMISQRSSSAPGGRCGGAVKGHRAPAAAGEEIGSSGAGTSVDEAGIPVNMFSSTFTLRNPGGAIRERGQAPSHKRATGKATHPQAERLQRRFSRRTRAVLGRVELARAALALFTSNAGAYRPILQKVLTFLFAYLDFLIEERSSMLYASAASGASSRHGTIDALASGGGSGDGAGEGGDGDGDGGDVVASAYQKVRLVEARMAALAEEASAQRDRFKAQIAMQQQQQEKLEGLLRHQMELNHLLVNRPLTMAQEDERPGLSLDATAKAARMTGAELEQFAARRRERDARYVQRLIAQAEREKALAELEEQVGELVRERTTLSDHVLSLQKLNSRYARQAVELATRLSILQEHNIGLAADVQLYQRDAVKDRQRREKVEKDLGVARNMLLTLLEVRSREILLGSRAVMQAHTNATARPREALLLAAAPVSRDGPAALAQHSTTTTTTVGAPGDADDAKTAAAVPVPASTRSSAALGAQEQTETAVLNAHDAVLRRQMQEMLAVTDTAVGEAAKSALLSILSVKGLPGATGEELHPSRNDRGASTDIYQHQQQWRALVGEPKDHPWAPPYGRSDAVPRHLRCTRCVRLLPLHPLVAESFVHELLTQRQDLIDHLSLEAEAEALLLLAPTTSTAAAQKRRWPTDSAFAAALNTAPPPAPRMAPLDEFVEIFVNIVWLNRSARFLPLLPQSAQAQPAVGAASDSDKTSTQRGMWLQQLHSLLCSTSKVPEELLQLPEEGLRLTYSLDATSRRSDAGFLTYAYGLATRRMLSEVVFDVLWRERATFLAMCEHVDRQRAEAKASPPLRAAGKAALADGTPHPVSGGGGGGAGSSSNSTAKAGDAAETEGEPVKLLGCIPMVQLARVLATMFPSYPVTKLEELVLAAAEDGTDGAQSPVMVYYTVLLPQRLLPGSAAATASATTTTVDRNAASPEASAAPPARSAPPAPTPSAMAASYWEEGRFANLFYKSICDDALEAVQVVQDSVSDYGQNRAAAQAAKQQQLRRGWPAGAAAATDQAGPPQATASVPTTATIKQLCTFGLQGVAPAEERRWGSAVRAALQRWPRMLQTGEKGTALAAAAPASPTALVREDEGREGGTRTEASERQILSAGAPAAAVGAAGSDTADISVAATTNATDANTQVSITDAMQFLRRHVLLRRGPYPRAQTRRCFRAALHVDERIADADSDVGEGGEEQEGGDSGGSWWCPSQQQYLAALQARWEQYITPGEPALPDDVGLFYSCLWHLDPARALPWSTDVVGEAHPRLLRCPRNEKEESARQRHKGVDGAMQLLKLQQSLGQRRQAPKQAMEGGAAPVEEEGKGDRDQ